MEYNNTKEMTKRRRILGLPVVSTLCIRFGQKNIHETQKILKKEKNTSISSQLHSCVMCVNVGSCSQDLTSILAPS